MSPGSEGSLLSKWDRGLTKVLKIFQDIGIGFIIFMVLMTVAHSMGRYFFSAPIPGMAELSSLMLVVLIFLLVGYGAIQKRHVVMGIFVDRLPEKAQRIIISAGYLLCLVTAGLLVWQTLVRALHLVEKTAILGLPVSPAYYIVAFCWGLLWLAFLTCFIYSVIDIAARKDEATR